MAAVSLYMYRRKRWDGAGQLSCLSIYVWEKEVRRGWTTTLLSLYICMGERGETGLDNSSPVSLYMYGIKRCSRAGQQLSCLSIYVWEKEVQRGWTTTLWSLYARKRGCGAGQQLTGLTIYVWEKEVRQGWTTTHWSHYRRERYRKELSCLSIYVWEKEVQLGWTNFRSHYRGEVQVETLIFLYGKETCWVETLHLTTVKPLNNGHTFCRAFMATTEQWPLPRGVI